MFEKLMLENEYREIVEGQCYEKDLDKNRMVEVIKLEKGYVFNLRYLTNKRNKIKDEVVKEFECDTLQDVVCLVKIYR